MRTGKKILAFLLAEVMVFTLLPVGALADEATADTSQNITVYKADGTVVGNYATIKAAGDAAVPADGTTYTIQLNQNITQVGSTAPDASEKLIFVENQKIILELNGHTMPIQIICGESGAELTIKDSSADESGKLIGIAGYEAMIIRRGGKVTLESGTVEGNDSANAWSTIAVTRIKNSDTTQQENYENIAPGEFIMNGGTVVQSATTGKAGFGIVVMGAKATINGGEVIGKINTAIGGNGSNYEWYKDTEITINGGTLTGAGSAVYHPQRGKLTIHGGELIATEGSGVVMRGGTVVVMDGGKIRNKVGGTHLVGDAKNEIPCSSIILDDAAKYYDFEGMDANIVGGYFVDDSLSPDIIGSSESGKQLELVALSEDDPEYKNGYRYTLGESAAIADVRSSVGESDVDTTTEVDETAIAAAKTVAVEPTEEMSDIAAELASKITEKQKESYLNQAKDKVPDATSLHVQTYLHIGVTSYDADKKDNLKLDIQPKTRVVASSTGDPEEIVLTAADGETVNSVVISSTVKDATVKGDTPVTITLPSGFVSATTDTVYVYHNGVECKGRKVEASGSDFVLGFTTDGFSPFVITKTDSAVASITKDNVTTKYSTYAAAVAAAENGDTITVLVDPTETNKITVKNKNVTLVPATGVTIDLNYVVTNGTATQNDDGSVTIKKPAGSSSSGSDEEEEETNESGFVDVPDDTWYTDAVNWAVENKIAAGVTSSLFMPGRACTRAEAVTFLWRAAGQPEPTTTVCPFTDVSEGDYCYKAVLWAVENDITAGVTTTEFGKNWTCTRAHAVTFLWRWASRRQVSMTNPFTDVPAGQYYETPVLWALGNGITAGITETTFAPKMACNRAHIVTFVYRYMGK